MEREENRLHVAAELFNAVASILHHPERNLAHNVATRNDPDLFNLENTVIGTVQREDWGERKTYIVHEGRKQTNLERSAHDRVENLHDLLRIPQCDGRARIVHPRDEPFVQEDHRGRRQRVHNVEAGIDRGRVRRLVLARDRSLEPNDVVFEFAERVAVRPRHTRWVSLTAKKETPAVAHLFRTSGAVRL